MQRPDDLKKMLCRAMDNVRQTSSDFDLNPDVVLPVGRVLKPAAVLIAVTTDGQLILTKRATHLKHHPGQIAFAGGRKDDTDRDLVQTALREADEEIGLLPGAVDVVGRMPDYSTGSGYRIAPVLGIVQPGFDLHINPDEVDAAFEVPLAFLMDPANHRRESRLWQEKERFYYTMPFGDRFIWGVTAGIIRTLYERLYA